ncbi:MAG: pyruvate synthase subunit PorD [Candidatus Schekmanbacteria bacterium]|nr:MAG: pyruvate synthase subunit PorD [Candidatus Schekmanbacteria bacterium]
MKKKIEKIPIALYFQSNTDWRFETPKVNKDKCIKCGVCYLYCPDSAIKETDDGYFEADLTLCKGCGMCEKQCVTGCISMEKEKMVPRHPLYK